MKNAFFAFGLLVLFSLLTFSACQTDTMKDMLPTGFSKTGYPIGIQDEAEKYLPAQHSRIEGQYIVMLDNNAMMPGALLDTLEKAGRDELSKAVGKRQEEGTAQLSRFLEEWGVEQNQVLHLYTEVISGFAATLSDEQVARLLRDERVASVAENQMVELDMPKTDSVVGAAKTQVVPCGITRHNGPSTGPSYKWIWIVDSGVAVHNDLNVVTNSTYAKSFVNGSPFDDCAGHGTHVAGIAAAKNNTMGVVGMSAGALVVPVRIFGCNNSSSVATIIAGINHVALYDEPGDVCNLSLGGFYGLGCSTYSSYKNAVTNLAASGTWVVIAAGNDGANAAYYEPGCLNGTRILTVANMDCYNAWNWSSNYGIGPVDWIAVGTNVLSTWPGNQYNYLTGTSMSAPHVSGIVHARQSNPVQCGSVYRYNVPYKVACR